MRVTQKLEPQFDCSEDVLEFAAIVGAVSCLDRDDGVRVKRPEGEVEDLSDEDNGCASLDGFVAIVEVIARYAPKMPGPSGLESSVRGKAEDVKGYSPSNAVRKSQVCVRGYCVYKCCCWVSDSAWKRTIAGSGSSAPSSALLPRSVPFPTPKSGSGALPVSDSSFATMIGGWSRTMRALTLWQRSTRVLQSSATLLDW